MSVHHSVYRGSMESYEEELFKNGKPTNKATPYSNMNLANLQLKPRFNKGNKNSVGDGTDSTIIDSRLTSGFNYNIDLSALKGTSLNDGDFMTEDYIKNFLAKNQDWHKRFNTIHLNTDLDVGEIETEARNEYESNGKGLSRTSSVQSFKEHCSMQEHEDDIVLSHYSTANNSYAFKAPETCAAIAAATTMHASNNKYTNQYANQYQNQYVPQYSNQYNNNQYSTSTVPSNKPITKERQQQQQPEERSGGMDMIMLLGLLLGLVVSKCLQYLQLYIVWFKKQTIQLRNAFVGEISFWDIVDFEDNTRFSQRTKLLLIPLIGTCTFVYGIISLMHFTTRIMLSRVPKFLLDFVHRLTVEA